MALGRLARDFQVASRATRRSSAASPAKPLGGVAGVVAELRRFGTNLPRRQAPRWGGGVGGRRRKSLRRRPPFSSAAGRGGLRTRGGAGPRVPQASQGLGLSVRHTWCTDVSLGAARRAWGIPLAGGASPLPRVKYPGHPNRCKHGYTYECVYPCAFHSLSDLSVRFSDAYQIWNRLKGSAKTWPKTKKWCEALSF